MRSGKLIVYAVTGVITGLLMENMMLRIRGKAAGQARELKKGIKTKAKAAMQHMH